MFRQVVQLCHGKLFLLRDSLPGSFKTKPICLVKAAASPAACPSSRPEFPAPWACTALQSHSSVLTLLCQVSLERLPVLLFTNSFTLEEWGAWKMIWIKRQCELKAEWEAQNISGQRKASSYPSSWWKSFQGLSLPASPFEWARHHSSKWETSKSSIIWIIKISSCSLPHFKRQEFWVLLAVIECFELLALKKGR